MKPLASTQYNWCARKECWLHPQICRANALDRARKECLICLQPSLFSVGKTTPSARKSMPPGEGTGRERDRA
jgi:hypothetical protein